MFRQDPLNTIMALGSRFTPVALRTAATLRLPSLVHEGHSTVDALTERTGCDTSALGRVMHYLSLLGVFTETPEKTYELTDVGRVLLDDHPSGLRRWLDFEERSRLVEKRFEPAVDELLEAVRTGRPVYEKVYGRDFWSDLAANPEIDKSFNEGIARTANRIVPELARIYDWASVKHVVDVGGGKGALLARLLGEHPELRGTLLELPNVVEQAEDVLAPVADRCETAPGSFFDPMPAGADVYLIANTLHNWSDDNAEKILRRCVEAAGPGNRVVVVERLLDSGKDPVMAAYADLLMLVLLGARERTAEDFREIGGRVGLELTETLRFETPGMWLLEFVVRP
ncbi:methyltransferase [Allokutzneria albata]|uniref:O-methyltransferase n=1 Tax=Allokutzneria albata TaxID=211114 RepID=A0A1G9TZJ3_ALLAB|nr:methyltransferase [Allokutzneria albata]SDM53159.1 O-methyltransferase [Allokutzneria albata]